MLCRLAMSAVKRKFVASDSRIERANDGEQQAHLPEGVVIPQQAEADVTASAGRSSTAGLLHNAVRSALQSQGQGGGWTRGL